MIGTEQSFPRHRESAPQAESADNTVLLIQPVRSRAQQARLSMPLPQVSVIDL